MLQNLLIMLFGISLTFYLLCSFYASYRVAAWIEYYQLLPDIIEFFHIVLNNLWVVKMYGNNGTFYGGTKLYTQQSQSTSIIRDNIYW